MLSADDFRRIALGFDGALENAHMGHPDFRAHGRIFATIQNDERGMVKLTPEQQRIFVRDRPAAFVPESGAWGLQGCTRVMFEAVDDEILGEAMTLAWQNSALAAAKKRPVKRAAKKPAAKKPALKKRKGTLRKKKRS